MIFAGPVTLCTCYNHWQPILHFIGFSPMSLYSYISRLIWIPDNVGIFHLKMCNRYISWGLNIHCALGIWKLVMCEVKPMSVKLSLWDLDSSIWSYSQEYKSSICSNITVEHWLIKAVNWPAVSNQLTYKPSYAPACNTFAIYTVLCIINFNTHIMICIVIALKQLYLVVCHRC